MISSNPIFIPNTDGTFTVTDAGRRIIDSHIETSDKMQQLIKDQVMGGDSWMLGSVQNERGFEAYQASENYNDQWIQLNNAGPYGQQAAKFLEQMITEKRSNIDTYLKGYDVLAAELSSIVKLENLQSIDLETILDNVKAGRLAADNADGSALPESALINRFQEDFKQQITAIQQLSDEIYTFPKHLSNWLDQKNIDRPLVVDKLAEKYQYIGHNGKSAGVSALDEVSNKFGAPKSSWVIEGSEIYASLVGFMGDSKYAVRQPAQALMREDQRENYQAYVQLSQPFADTFNDQIATELEPRFTFQDIIDNLREGRDPSAVYTPQGYQQHPQAAKIEAFYQDKVVALQSIVQMQQGLEKRVTMLEWLENPNNADRAYQKMEEIYDIERWETGDLSRMARGFRKFDQDSFTPDGSYHLKDEVLTGRQWKVRLKEEATALASDLQQLLDDTKGLSAEPFTLDQLIANFRQGKPLGLMENGKPHPYADQIQFAFSTEQLRLADYIDSQWLRDGTTEPQLTREEKTEKLVDNVLSMIRESREVWTFDELLGIDEPDKEKNSSKEAVAEINNILKQVQTG